MLKIIGMFLFCLLFFIRVGTSQIIIQDLSGFHDSIIKNASVLKQYENLVFEVESIDRSSLKVHKVFSILNENGRRALFFSEYVNKMRSLEDVEIQVFNDVGKPIVKYKKKDLFMQAYGDNLVDDGFYYYLPISANSFPVTVELKYEIKYRNTLHFPVYEILVPGESVLRSTFTAKVPETIGLRYKTNNAFINPKITNKGTYIEYQWEAKNLSAIESEAGAADYRYCYPTVILAPNKFSYFGLKGDLSSWESYGSWMGQLYTGLDQLSEERKRFFQNLVSDTRNEKEKIEKIYKHLQENFRYVSIQLGIGGFKPFSAEFTDQKKYGDCKGLSNYMKAALKAVGINSYIAIINSGYDEEPIDPNFTSDFGLNHVILCVPQNKDTVWLECTSNSSETGVLGPETENRYALLITENGGKLVPTPRSLAKANTFSVLTFVELFEDASGNTETVFRSSSYYKDYMNEILKSKKDRQKEGLVLWLGHKQPDEFEFSQIENSDHHTAKLKTSIEKVPEFTAGSKWFLSTRLYKLWSGKLPKSENRKLDFYFHHPFERTDTTIYKIPDGFILDALPKEKQISCSYGSYKTKYWFDETKRMLYTSATLILEQHKIPAAKYAEVKKFFDDVLMDDSQRIVIKKQ